LLKTQKHLDVHAGLGVQCLNKEVFMPRIKPKRTVSGTDEWKCSTCGEWLSREGFYTEKRNPQGIKSQCKRCHCKTAVESRDKEVSRKRNRKWMRESGYKQRPEVAERERRRSAERRKNEPEKYTAMSALNNAVRGGRVKKPAACYRCGVIDVKLQGHHSDYNKPFDVVWLCPGCHAALHRGVWAYTFELCGRDE